MSIKKSQLDTKQKRETSMGTDRSSVDNFSMNIRVKPLNIQSTPLNRVTSGPVYFDPVKQRNPLTGGSMKRSILYLFCRNLERMY